MIVAGESDLAMTLLYLRSYYFILSLYLISYLINCMQPDDYGKSRFRHPALLLAPWKERRASCPAVRTKSLALG